MCARRGRRAEAGEGLQGGLSFPELTAPTGLGPRTATRRPSLHVSPRPRTWVTAPNMAAKLPSSGLVRTPQGGWGGGRSAPRKQRPPHSPPGIGAPGRQSARGPARVAAASRAMTQQLQRLLPSPWRPGLQTGFSAPGPGGSGPEARRGRGWGWGQHSGSLRASERASERGQPDAAPVPLHSGKSLRPSHSLPAPT